MLIWPDLRMIAEHVSGAWQQVKTKAVRFWEGSGLLPRSVPLPGGAVATLADTWDPATGYDAVAEIFDCDGDAKPVIAFHFTTTQEDDRRTLRERNAEIREQRRLVSTMREAEEKLSEARSVEEWDSVTERYRVASTRYSQLIERNRLHALRKGLQVKRALAAHRAGQTQLPTHGFPILLSAETTLDEVCLKMALLVFRRGVLDEREVADEMKSVVRRVAALLHVRAADAREVLSAAAISVRGLGYIGDVSPRSFRAYLRSVLLSIRRERGKLLAVRKTLARAAAGRARRVSPVPPKVAPDQGGRVRLPGKSEPHPWAGGAPALLSRLAIDFEIDPRVARRWAQDGRFEVRDCRAREEWTVLGKRATGTIEVPASERPRWEACCARWYDMRVRKRRTEGGSVAEKKRAYRRHKLDHAELLVREQALKAGLPPLPVAGREGARR